MHKKTLNLKERYKILNYKLSFYKKNYKTQKNIFLIYKIK